MTKAAVAKEQFGNRKSFGKNETPNKQKGLNAVAKTPNSAMKQIKTPKSNSKPQANGNASAKKTPSSAIKKEVKPENEDEEDEDEEDEDEEDEDEDEDEEDSDGLEEEEDSDEGDEEAETDDDAGLEEEGGEEEEDEDEDEDEDDSDEDEGDDDSVLAGGNEIKKVIEAKKEVQEEEESEDDDEDEEDDDDDDDDEEEDEDEDEDAKDKSDKEVPAKQPAQKQKSPADKAADQENYVFLGNLDFKIEKADVEKFLAEKLSPGEVDRVEFLPKIAGRARGYCFAKLTNKAAVDKVMKLNGTEWHGRALKVGPKMASKQAEKRKYLRISNISNQINDGQVLELLTSVIKLSEITTYKRARANAFGAQGTVQLQLLSEESYKKLQKINGKELGGRKIEVLETANKLRSVKGDGVGKSKGNQNRNKGNQNKNQGNPKKGNAQQAGGRYFKNEENKNRKRPGNNADGVKFKKQKSE